MKDISDRPRVLTVRLVEFEENNEAWVKFEVTDTGVGIPLENLTRIFSQGFTTKKAGHGFGLHSGALSAKLMGGSFTVQSEGEGQGATFTLTLPAKRREVGVAWEKAPHISVKKERSSSLAKKRHLPFFSRACAL